MSITKQTILTSKQEKTFPISKSNKKVNREGTTSYCGKPVYTQQCCPLFANSESRKEPLFKTRSRMLIVGNWLCLQKAKTVVWGEENNSLHNLTSKVKLQLTAFCLVRGIGNTYAQKADAAVF